MPLATLNNAPTLKLSAVTEASPVALNVKLEVELIVEREAVAPEISGAVKVPLTDKVLIDPLVELISSVVIFLFAISIAAALVETISVNVTENPDPKVFGLFAVHVQIHQVQHHQVSR